MPILFIASLAVQILCGYHVVKTGQDKYWLFLIMMAPGIGCVIYGVAIMLPSMSRSPEGQRTYKAIVKTIDPTRNIRALRDELSLCNTPHLHEQLADEYMSLGQVSEAIVEYQKALTGHYQNNPDTMLKLAQAYFDQENYRQCLQTLMTLLEKNPSYVSQDGHLLQARALYLNGDSSAAESSFKQVIEYYVGPQAHLYYAQMLCDLGRKADAIVQLDEILSYARIAPKHYKKFHKDCLLESKKLRDSLSSQ